MALQSPPSPSELTPEGDYRSSTTTITLEIHGQKRLIKNDDLFRDINKRILKNSDEKKQYRRSGVPVVIFAQGGRYEATMKGNPKNKVIELYGMRNEQRVVKLTVFRKKTMAEDAGIILEGIEAI